MLTLLFRRLFLRFARKQLGVRRIESPSAQLYVAGGVLPPADQVERALRNIGIPHIARLICADLGRGRRPAPVPIVYVPPELQCEFRRAFGNRRPVFMGSGTQGLYVPLLRLVLITGILDSSELQAALGHELAHGFLHAVVGDTGRVPWAEEGYAELLTARARAIQGDYAPAHLSRALEHVVGLINSGAIMTTEELLQVQPRRLRVLVWGRYPWFHEHSAMLMYALMRLARSRPQLTRVCREILLGYHRNGRQVMSALEQGAGLPMAGLHEYFERFCRWLAAQPRPQPRILSPETMVQ